MPRIHVLDKAVAELIAAGEVVERPASIVKELVENAVDAGSSAITIEIKGGGVRYIRVSDNGCGIEREDIPHAFLRHATSKVRSAEDLTGILTLGFRGEALASIAAMCRVELTTRTADDPEGTTCRVAGGELLESVPAGCPAGTTIVVRDVFFNTPARMKFLKRDISEGNSVAQVVDKCALAHPEIAFRFIRDGQTKLRTSGSGELLPAIRAIYGRELCETMLPVDYTYEGRIRVHGCIAAPAGAKASRAYQNFFINSRYVRTRTASAALEEAFKNRLMGGKYPACVLNLEIDAATVDVNVHPAKIEVRFTDERPVFHAVYFAAKSVLAAQSAPLEVLQEQTPRPRDHTVNALTMHRNEPVPVQQRMSAQEFRDLFGTGEERQPYQFSGPVALHSPDIDISVDDDLPPLRRDAPLTFRDKPAPEPPAPVINVIKETAARPEHHLAPPEMAPPLSADDAPDYRLIGELFTTYILLEQGEDLVLVDKHAAHERILYEQLKQNLSYGNRQMLLTPLSVTLARGEYDALTAEPERVAAMGFAVEDFGDSTVLVRETPIELPAGDIPGILVEIAGRLQQGNRDLTPERLDRLYYSIACRSAIQAGDKQNSAELEEIIRRLRQNPEITHCPHGRPVLVRLTRGELEKMFGRII